jgi:two-component system response regulator HydG
MNKRIARISPAAMALLDHYEWPGNIRELENAIERAMVVGREPELGEGDFALRLPIRASSPRTLEDIERAHILAVLEDCNGNQTQAAEVLDIDRVTLHNKLKKYGWKRITAEAS